MILWQKFDLAILAIGSDSSEEKVEETEFCQNIKCVVCSVHIGKNYFKIECMEIIPILHSKMVFAQTPILSLVQDYCKKKKEFAVDLLVCPLARIQTINLAKSYRKKYIFLYKIRKKN